MWFVEYFDAALNEWLLLNTSSHRTKVEAQVEMVKWIFREPDWKYRVRKEA